MIKYDIYNSINGTSLLEKEEIVTFLQENLDQYGDKREDIERAISYAIKESSLTGGFILVARKEDQIVGAVVMNTTGMKGYIPENILVYIAISKNQRGKGLGKEMMEKAIDMADGDIALHVEPDNPARKMYKKMGFSSKYIEMRYHKKESKRKIS